MAAQWSNYAWVSLACCVYDLALCRTDMVLYLISTNFIMHQLLWILSSCFAHRMNASSWKSVLLQRAAPFCSAVLYTSLFLVNVHRSGNASNVFCECLSCWWILSFSYLVLFPVLFLILWAHISSCITVISPILYCYWILCVCPLIYRFLFLKNWNKILHL